MKISEKSGKTLAVICRINASDDVLGGQTPQDAAAVASYLEKECGVDALHVSRAVHLHDEYMWAPSALHEGFSANCVTEIKQAVHIPVITVGRYTEPQYAELMVEEGRADLVAFGRQSIADPNLPQKAKDGKLDLLLPCIGCLQGCVPHMFKGEAITCLVNPLVGREMELFPAEQKKTWRLSAEVREDCMLPISVHFGDIMLPYTKKKRSWAEICVWRLILREKDVSMA